MDLQQNFYPLQVKMGNTSKNNSNDEFLKAVKQLKKYRNQNSVEKVSTHLQQRYRDHMIDSLVKQEMPKNIKRFLMECIENKIRKQDLTSVISVLNSLRQNNAEQLLKFSFYKKQQLNVSKYVVVKFNQNKKRQSNPQQKRKELNDQYLLYRDEDTTEGRVRQAGYFISKQLNKVYHPFKTFCKRFADILSLYEQETRQSFDQNEYDKREQLQRKTIKEFSLFLVAGCLGIYRKWIIEYTGLEDKKYQKWIYSLVINQIWSTNQGHMFSVMLKIIQRTKVPLKIDFFGLSSCSSIGLLHPKQFAIDPQLQIQGNYFISIYQMSSLTQKKRPKQMLDQLQIIQKSICLDIDNFHKLQQKGQVYEVNGDNIMGIVSYTLSRISNKIEEISNILLFLKMIYGEGIYYSMDTSSYMYSTICGAIQFLESKKFEYPKKQSQIQDFDKDLKDTNCVEDGSFTSNKSKPQV